MPKTKPLRPDGVMSLLVILLAAAALRLGDLRQPLVDAFSWREAATAMTADALRASGWRALAAGGDVTGGSGEFPLVSLLTAALYAVFGREIWLGRAVAAGFGLLAVLALHRVVEPLFGRSRAHAAALMLAILPGAVAVDRSFMPDAAGPALACTGLWLFLAWLERGGAGRLVGAAAVTALAAVSSPVGLIVLAPMVYAAAADLRRPRAPAPGRLVAPALALAGVLATAALWTALGPRPEGAAAGIGLDDLPRWQERLLPTAFVLLAGLGLLARPRGGHRARWLFHVWAAAAAATGVLALDAPPSGPALFTALAPPLAALAGAGLIAVAGFRVAALRAPAPARAGFVIAVCLLSGASAQTALKAAPARDGYDLGRKLDDLAAPDERVIAVAPTVGDPVAVFYSRRRGWAFPGRSDGPATMAELERLESRGARWFGVAKSARDARGRAFLDRHRAFVAQLDRHARRVVDDERMLVWRLPPAGD
jgi:4-amino-4-deoxy-L-arabinose transferase-like glycosyltransferase